MKLDKRTHSLVISGKYVRRYVLAQCLSLFSRVVPLNVLKRVDILGALERKNEL